MAQYIDGFVLAIKNDRLKEYKKMATEAKGVWMKFGALDYKECVMEDPEPKEITLTFPKMAKAKANETVIFAYITYKSRKHRDQVNKKVMAYFSKKYSDEKMHQDMPFDMKRMAYGGFGVLVSA